MINLILMVGAVIGAIQAVRSNRLLRAAIWLASVSALVSILLYRLGAHEVAAIELSVGAGLVTVLFVFGISIAGEDAMTELAIVPRLARWGLAGAVMLLLAWFIMPVPDVLNPVAEGSFATVLWQERSLDVLVQIVLIFAGVLGVLGLLSQEETAVTTSKSTVSELATAVNTHELPWNDPIESEFEPIEKEAQP